MAFAFRIHEPQNNRSPQPISPTVMTDGWTQTGYVDGTLLENISINNASGKSGTSIPSIFARMFLFEGAFQLFQGKSLDMINTPPDSLKAEAALISECLDMLEFLFQHGADRKLVIKRWSSAQQIQALRTSHQKKEHTRLAQVLDDEIKNYPDFANIFLFYWCESTPESTTPQEFLIGGTSPMTLVFTSPNWKKILEHYGFHFNRTGDASRLFDTTDIRSLSQREETFKNMLYSLRMAFHQQLQTQAKFFEKYIEISYNGEPDNAEVLRMGANPANFFQTYDSLVDSNGNAVVTGGIPICYMPIKVVSGYEIVPTVDRYQYKYTDSKGQARVIPTPLMLDENGLTDVPYIGKSFWNPDSCIINEAEVKGQKLHERVLPGGMGIQYPFLIWSDFLEDKILKVPYDINGENFVTAANGESNYLLPVKRTFFNYFQIDDLKQRVSLVVRENEVEVNLRIPIKNNIRPEIVIKHTYTQKYIKDFSFTMGFFPFYRTGGNDMYKVLSVVEGEQNYSADFYNVDGRNIHAAPAIRTKADTLIPESRYYSINNAFDIVEVRSDQHNCAGLIIPNMTNCTMGGATFEFAVDFGTTNTYIAYKNAPDATPETLEFGGQDKQVVYLFKAVKGNLQSMFKNNVNREFSPAAIGMNEPFHFPTITATCELIDKQPVLFDSASIGFQMMHETINNLTRQGTKYTTQLKWLLEQDTANPHNNDLILAYFKHILWMLKNKAIQNGGNDHFILRLTFPQTMNNTMKDALVQLWNSAKQQLNLECEIDASLSESLSPYNVMVNDIQTNNFLNIDIGGGTNDMLFVNRNNNGQLVSANYSSAKFAGDDLWSDGVGAIKERHLRNGFAEFVLRKIDSQKDSYPSDTISKLNALKTNANTSGDIMSFLFSCDDIFHTSAAIRENKQLFSCVFIHYMALMYYVARQIRKLGINIPNHISFTGMGSKYLNLISSDPGQINNLTKLLLQKFTGMTVPSVFTIRNNVNNAKEITAKGAITVPREEFVIANDKLHAVVDYGFDTDLQLTYADVRKEDVQNKVLIEYNNFLGVLTDHDIATYLYDGWQITIPQELIQLLRNNAKNSYNTIAMLTPNLEGVKVSETLFFWPLKIALINCINTISQGQQGQQNN